MVVKLAGGVPPDGDRESDVPGSKNRDACALRFVRVAAGHVEASSKTSTAIHKTRASKTSYGKQTLLSAAAENVKAAPPNPSCSSPAVPGVGRPCVDPAVRDHPCVVSDSLVDDRGCLTNRPEC